MLCACAVIGTISKSYVGTDLNVQQYINLWPGLLLFVLTYAIAKLYPVVGMSPAEELRRTTFATTLVFALLATISVLFKEAESYSRAILLLTWALTLIFIPISR